MKRFQRFYLDKEKDIIVDLYTEDRIAPGAAGTYGLAETAAAGAAPNCRRQPGACRRRKAQPPQASPAPCTSFSPRPTTAQET